MTIRVDPDSIDRFAAQLQRFEHGANAVVDYIRTWQEQRTATQIGSQGLLNYFWMSHSDFTRRAEYRTTTTSTVGMLGSLGLSSAAYFYRHTDLAVAGMVDATYPAAQRGPLADYGDRVPASMRFEDRFEPAGYLKPPDGGELQPKTAALANFVGDLNDLISMSFWARQLMLEATGRDIVKDLIEWFSGDWEAIARLADAWNNCGSAVGVMRANVEQADEALADVWSGNAGEAAGAWAQQLATATGLESQFFYFLYEIYIGHVEIAYFAYQMINWAVGEMLDLVCEAVAVLVTTPTGIGPFLTGIAALVDAILFACDTIRQAYHAYRLAAAAIDKPGRGDQPEFAMDRLRLVDSTTGLPYSYRHPGVK